MSHKGRVPGKKQGSEGGMVKDHKNTFFSPGTLPLGYVNTANFPQSRLR